MNQKEKLYFEVLSKQCREAWTIFKNPMYRRALEIAQNLYKDKAHFVYELLQNTDDQGATMVRFILSRDSLIFVHNAPSILQLLILKLTKRIRREVVLEI